MAIITRPKPPAAPRAGDEDAIDDGAADRVEIGEPIPEDDKTVRAVEGEEQLAGEEEAASVDPDPSSERH